jgi:NAD(P)H-dependent flavin oxidoreductase YrpB (nitropropane dioxygenase family)
MAGPITTPLTTLLGVKHPIVLAGMFQVSGGKLAAAVANAGGLSVIGGYKCTPEQLRAIIDEMKSGLSNPDSPFGIEIALPKVGGSARKTNCDCTGGKLEELIDITINSGAKLFVGSAGVPPREVIDRLHEAGVLVMTVVGHPKHATKALDAGVDMVCAQGGEGRGQTGDIPSSVLVPAVVDVARRYKPPMLKGSTALVLAAGGVASGRSLAASLMQGAAGAWVSTRFVASEEANIPLEQKEQVVECDYDSTELTTVLTGRPLRMKPNDYIRKWHSRPEEIKKMCDGGIVPMDHDLKQGHPVQVPVMMGQVAGSIRDILPAGQIVENMVREATEMLRLASTYIQPRARL